MLPWKHVDSISPEQPFPAGEPVLAFSWPDEFMVGALQHVTLWVEEEGYEYRCVSEDGESIGSVSHYVTIKELLTTLPTEATRKA